MKNRLRILMAEHKKTLRDISEGTGIATSTLSKLKQEKTVDPDTKTLIKICKYFDVSLDELVPIKDVD